MVEGGINYKFSAIYTFQVGGIGKQGEGRIKWFSTDIQCEVSGRTEFSHQSSKDSRDHVAV